LKFPDYLLRVHCYQSYQLTRKPFEGKTHVSRQTTPQLKLKIKAKKRQPNSNLNNVLNTFFSAKLIKKL
jgi:hypothetical protein